MMKAFMKVNVVPLVITTFTLNYQLDFVSQKHSDTKTRFLFDTIPYKYKVLMCTDIYIVIESVSDSLGLMSSLCAFLSGSVLCF